MNRTILLLEKNLILLPATLIILPGLVYMLSMPLGDVNSVFSSGSIKRIVTFLSFETLSLLSAWAIYSIWVAIEQYLDNSYTITFSGDPFVYSAIVVGILISFSSLFELAYPNHYLKQVLGIRENQAFFAMYVFGLPVCIPAIHILALGRLNSANKAS